MDEDWSLTNSTDITNILVNKFKTLMDTTGGCDSCLSVNKNHYSRIIHNVVIAVPLDINQGENKCCFSAKGFSEVYRLKPHSALDNTLPQFSSYRNTSSIRKMIFF